MHLSRRALLATTGIAAGGLAGCLDGPLARDGVDGGYGAFFALADWTAAVVGEDVPVEMPISVGEVGHGWDPPAGLVADIASTDVFVHVDTPEFRWAQDVAAALEADYDGITVIDAFAGIESELLAWNPAGPTDSEEADPETAEVASVTLAHAASGDELADYHGDHWHGNLGTVGVGSSRSVTLVATDTDGRVIPLGDVLTVTAESHDEGVLSVENRGDHVILRGHEEGVVDVDLTLERNGETVWEAEEPVRANVETDFETDGATEFHDPHAWVDPVLARDMVDTIAEGLASADPDGADRYRENADAYREELAAVDAELASVVDAADRSTVVVAAHNAFQYLAHRYGFEIYTTAGVSPDAEPESGAVLELVEVIDGEGIDTILYDPFETHDPGESLPDAVDLLIEHSDATEYAPLTPVEGQTAAWNDRGWGYVEQMREVNIPSLAAALGVESW